MAGRSNRRVERCLTDAQGIIPRKSDEASICGTHQGQRSTSDRIKGRTHDRKRLNASCDKTLADRGPSTHESEPRLGAD